MCEFITGGGLSAEALPDSLVQEGALMRDALLCDLAQLGRFEIITMHDVRLKPSALAARSVAVSPGQFRQVFTDALGQVELVWLVAPESDGTLLELSELCYDAHGKGALFMGCGYDATLTGTSKTLCFEALQAANIYTLPTHAGEDLMQPEYFSRLTELADRRWVAKPEDGAGCEGIGLFASLTDLKAWIKQENRYLHYLAQPYQQGIAASFSMLCRNGKAWLLSCNQQHVVCDGGQFRLSGITVNGMSSYWQRFETIARKVARMLPDALGYVGVDVIVDSESDHKVYVVEINPRLTTSYVGLGDALECNPAKLILDCVLNDRFVMPAIARKQVEIQL